MVHQARRQTQKRGESAELPPLDSILLKKPQPKLMTAKMLLNGPQGKLLGIRSTDDASITDELLFKDEENTEAQQATTAPSDVNEPENDTSSSNDDDGVVAINLRVLQELRKAFTEADTDGGGGLDLEEFVEAFGKIIGKGLSQQELTNLFMKIDANSDGSVDWEEFTEYMLLENKGNEQMVQDETSVTYHAREEGHLDVSVTRYFHRKMIVGMVPLHYMNQYLTISTDGLIKVWDYSRSNKHVQTISVPKGQSQAWCTGCTQMQKSSRLAVSMMNRTLVFFDLPNFEVYCQLHPLRGSPMCVAYYSGEHSDDHEVLMCGDDLGVLTVWFLAEHWWFPNNATSGDKTAQPKGIHSHHSHRVHSDFITKVGYIPDLGSIVTSSLDCTLAISSLDRPTRQRVYTGHCKPVNSFVWIAKTNTMASVGMEHKVHLWNPYTCITSMTFEGHTAGICEIAINAADHQLITVSLDKRILVWGLSTNDLKQEMIDRELYRPQNEITTLFFDERNEWIVTASNKFKLWELSRQSPSPNRSHQAPVNIALFNSVFHQVVSASSHDVHIWNINTGTLTLRFRNPHGASGLTAMCFDGAGRRLITGADDGTIKMWNFNNGACLREFSRTLDGIPPPLIARSSEDVEITHLAYVTQDLSAGRKASIDLTREYVLATGWDRRIFVFDEEYATEVHEYSHYMPRDDQIHRGHRDDISCIVHCPPHLIASCSYDGKIKTWSLQGGYLRRSFEAFQKHIKITAKTNSSKNGFGFLLRSKSGKNPVQVSKRHFRSEKKLFTPCFEEKDDESELEENISCKSLKLVEGNEDSSSADLSVSVTEEVDTLKNPTSGIENRPIPVIKDQRGKPETDNRTDSTSEATNACKANNESQRKALKQEGKSKKPVADMLDEFGTSKKQQEKKQTVSKMIYLTRLDCLVSCSTDGCLRFWDYENGQLLASRCIAISSKKTVDTRPSQHLVTINTDLQNEFLVSGDAIGFLQVWDISQLSGGDFNQTDVDHNMTSKTSWRAHFKTITSVELAVLFEDKYIVTSSTDCLVMLWKVDGQCVGMFGQKRIWSLTDRLSWVQFKDKLVRKITVLGILRIGMDSLVGQSSRQSRNTQFLQALRKEESTKEAIERHKYSIAKSCYFARHMINCADDVLETSATTREQLKLANRGKELRKHTNSRTHSSPRVVQSRRIGAAERSWKVSKREEAERNHRLRLPELEDLSINYNKVRRNRQLRLSKSTPLL